MPGEISQETARWMLDALIDLLQRSKEVPYQEWLTRDQEKAQAAIARARAELGENHD